MITYLGPAVLALIGLLVVAGAAYWAHSIAFRPQDIAWGFDPPKNHFFLGLSRSGADEPWVMTFQTEAQNLTGEPILNVNSYIRSDLNNRQIPVVFNIDGTRVALAETDGIARDGYFQLVSEQFPSPDPAKTEGLPIGRFRSDIGPFTFVFEYDGKKYSRHFSLQEINEGVGRFIRETDENRARFGPKPGVTRKQPK